MHKKQMELNKQKNLQKQNLKSIDDKEQIKENWKLERKETSLFVDQKSNQKVQAKGNLSILHKKHLDKPFKIL